MLTLCNSHVTILNNGSAILVEHVLLSELAKFGASRDHHVGCLVEWTCITIAVLEDLCAGARCSLLISVAVHRILYVIVVENH